MVLIENIYVLVGPMRSLSEFVAIVARLHDHDVALCAAGANIDTLSCAQGLLRLVICFENANRPRRSAWIRRKRAPPAKRLGDPRFRRKSAFGLQPPSPPVREFVAPPSGSTCRRAPS